MTKPTATINPRRLKKLFREMVDIYSPSGKEEELTEFLAGYLHEHHLPVTLREVSDGRRNIEVVFSDSRPEVAFTGHIDTVPAFDIEEYCFEERGGIISGLGTADMKGGCAAMIEAFICAVESGKQTDKCGLFLVVGEEESGDGTAAMLAARSFPWAIVAEPTNLTPCLAHYGYLEMLVNTFGTRRHASMAGRSYNAIFSMLNMLLTLGEEFSEKHTEAVLNIRDIHSSDAGFAVPGSCQAWVDLHLPPNAEPQQLAKELKKIATKSLKESAAKDYEIEFSILAKGYELAEKGMLPKVMKEVFLAGGLEWKCGKFESHSDANLLYQAGCKPIILGPGQLAMAHTSDESIDFEQVALAAEIYYGIIKRL